ncbi:2-dehydropantoate 2-reductase [Acetobacteraceae bacterium H6797]|nr:2-dehydropantoate 2-reductase [Acetobacteraceae bacterium H6797]
MKVCVFGAGAIGGHLAARFSKAGAEVSVVARGANLEAIRTHGLTVEAHDGTIDCRPNASSAPAELGEQDYVVVTVKAPALPQVAASIRPLLGAKTAVAFVMNGIPWWYFDRIGGAREGQRLPEIDPGDVVREAIGVERVIGGVVYSACTVTEPGHVHVETKENRVIFGEPDGSLSDRVKALSAMLEAGGMPSPVTADIRTEIWGKLMGNISNGPLCILSRQGGRDTYAAPAVKEAALKMLAEAQAIAAAYGCQVPGTPEGRMGRIQTLNHKPSILQDLELGRPMEIAAMMAVPLRMGLEAGVPVPTLSLMIALASKAAEAAGLYKP